MQFTHTYIGHSPLDERESDTFLFILSSDKYQMRPVTGRIEYCANDKSHVWRINMERNKFGKCMVEIKRAPSEIFDITFEVL